MSLYATTGKVFLVGAGPGDPDLLTIKAMRCLQSAEVVLADRLVSPDILRSYVPDTAEVIHVGKQCRRGASTPQPVINELLVHYARQGKQVVRLKGGDVSLFSNILDELQVLAAAHIPYEIVPGITAALGAAAYSGIPLTARGHATAVRFLTCHRPEHYPSTYWAELARTTDTLVFYMSADTLGEVVEQLQVQGIPGDRPLAVIEQATTPYQKVHLASIHTYEHELAGKRFASPTLVLVGEVAALHRQFAWQPENATTGTYFPPVEKESIVALSEAERA